jgi:hypothetical protein
MGVCAKCALPPGGEASVTAAKKDRRQSQRQVLFFHHQNAGARRKFQPSRAQPLKHRFVTGLCGWPALIVEHPPASAALTPLSRRLAAET